MVTAKGLIKPSQHIDDHAMETALETLLPKFPGVRSVDATVHQGVVELDGQVENAATRDQMTHVSMQIEGVRMVVNRLKTDAQVLSAGQLVWAEIRRLWEVVARRWLLVLLALGMVVLFTSLARLFNRYSETLLAPLVSNVLLRSVMGSLIGSGLIFIGVMIALSALQLTQAVLSIVGLAGVIGLALGFAFRDIAENFIASILLGMRRPFRLGDYVTVAGHAGVVKSLNTRSTVLVTLDGQHVRIPNAVIYKEILVNASASPTSRGTFDIMIPYESSTADALDAVTTALPRRGRRLARPAGARFGRGVGTHGRSPARVLLESARRDRRLQAEQRRAPQGESRASAGGHHAAADPRAGFGGRRGAADAARSSQRFAPERAGGGGAFASFALVTHAQAQANLRRDSHAADAATAVPAEGHSTPLEHAQKTTDAHVGEEGANLLNNGH